MTLVLEESEDIPLELLSPLLASVKKGNEVNMIAVIVCNIHFSLKIIMLISLLFSGSSACCS